MEPMNRQLFNRLEKVFGEVRVSKSGEGLVEERKPDWARGGKLSSKVWDWGETYSVHCPFCNDNKPRLSISHAWAVRDSLTRDDRLHLCYCFHGSCLDTRDRQKSLHAKVFPLLAYADAKPVEVKHIAKSAFKPQVDVPLPVGAEILAATPKDHPALQYLSSRGFDLDELYPYYGSLYYLATGFREPRLVIPIYVPDDRRPLPRLAGWQARLIQKVADRRIPKYVTAKGLRKSELLYGLGAARFTLGPVAIVEGITDAWRAGPAAVALMGKTISMRQCELIVQYFGIRPVVVLLDDDAADDAKKVVIAIARARRLAGVSAPVHLGKLPAGRHDPGDCTRQEIAEAIAVTVNHGQK